MGVKIKQRRSEANEQWTLKGWEEFNITYLL